MAYFSDDQISELNDTLNTVDARAEVLVESYLIRQYQTQAGSEYARHGFCRRVNSLAHCVTRVYELLPLELDGLPELQARDDATAFIQSFVFNTFSALDNLALIWVNEKTVLGKNGKPLPSPMIGLTADKKSVRASFPAEFAEYLSSIDNWFQNLVRFRHALGHRIPLYIPPFTIDPSEIPEYNRLEEESTVALKAHDWNKFNLLKGQQSSKQTFRPLMAESVYAEKAPIVFHAQMLADFATVEEIGQKMLSILPPMT